MHDELDLPDGFADDMDPEFWEQAYDLTEFHHPRMFKKLENWVPKFSTHQRPSLIAYITRTTPNGDRAKKFRQCARHMFRLMDKGALS